MSIWAAAAYIVAVSVAAFASVFAKMVYKEVRDCRKRPIQLPLPSPPQAKKEHDEERVHATV
jgi:hypothetical protein